MSDFKPTHRYVDSQVRWGFKSGDLAELIINDGTRCPKFRKKDGNEKWMSLEWMRPLEPATQPQTPMNNAYVIEKNIPIPTNNARRNGPNATKYPDFRLMEVGDSVLVHTGKEKRERIRRYLYTRATNLSKQSNQTIKITTQTVSDEALRVWRVE